MLNVYGWFYRLWNEENLSDNFLDKGVGTR